MEYVLELEPGQFLANVKQLFQRTEFLCDAELCGIHEGLLAASGALGPDGGSSRGQVAALLSAEPSEVSSALKNLIHGQEVSFHDESPFFRLFAAVGKMKVSSCEELCRQTVQSSAYQRKPITLRLAADVFDAVQNKFYGWFSDPLTPFADVSIVVQNEGGSEAIRAHSLILAASCEYFRGLWAGGFVEATHASGPREVRISSFDGVIRPFLKAIYGAQVVLDTFDELLQVFRLADQWQCERIRELALQLIRDEFNNEDSSRAIDVLDQCPRLPDDVLRAAAEALGDWKEIEEEDMASLSLAGAVRLLQARCDYDMMCKDGKAPLLDMDVKLPADDKDAFLQSPEWLQIQPDVMSKLVYNALAVEGDESEVDFARHLLRWAQSGDVRAEEALARLAQLHDATEGDACLIRKAKRACSESVLRKAMRACFDSLPIAAATFNALYCTEDESKAATTDDNTDEGPANKRRKTGSSGSEWTSVLCALEKATKELLTNAAKAWAVDNFDNFSKSEAWLQLNSRALVYIAVAASARKADDDKEEEKRIAQERQKEKEAERAAADKVQIIEDDKHDDEDPETLRSLSVTKLKERLRARGLVCSGQKADLIDRLASSMKKTKKAEPVKDDDGVEKHPKIIKDCESAVSIWAKGADLQSVFDALRLLAGSGGADEEWFPMTYTALLNATRRRASAAEQRLAAIEQGRVQEELASAVREATGETEARMRCLQEEAEASLKHQLAKKDKELCDLKRSIVALCQGETPLAAADS